MTAAIKTTEGEMRTNTNLRFFSNDVLIPFLILFRHSFFVAGSLNDRNRYGLRNVTNRSVSFPLLLSEVPLAPVPQNQIPVFERADICIQTSPRSTFRLDEKSKTFRGKSIFLWNNLRLCIWKNVFEVALHVSRYENS